MGIDSPLLFRVTRRHEFPNDDLSRRVHGGQALRIGAPRDGIVTPRASTDGCRFLINLPANLPCVRRSDLDVAPPIPRSEPFSVRAPTHRPERIGMICQCPQKLAGGCIPDFDETV